MDTKDHWLAFQAAAGQFLGKALTPEQLAGFEKLYALVVTANQQTNLTRITDLGDFCTRHLLDSLSILTVPLQSSPSSWIDIGSGAGFPALPIALLHPSHRVVAVESLRKKADFMLQAAQVLELPHFEAIPDRSETLAHQPTYREQFDVATARAVASLPTLLELCLPFVKPGGHFIAMKTQNTLESELQACNKALSLLGATHEATFTPDIPDLGHHRLVVFRKTGLTPVLYPRKPGLPAKKPL